jgi:Ca2+-binding RTX toxin-like protein
VLGVESVVGTSKDDYFIASNLGNKFDGASGNDVLVGGNKDDELLGGDGTDSLTGDNGNDSIDGGTGNDTLTGGDGTDSLAGGTGNDTYLFNTNDVDAGETITEAASGGTDTISVITTTDFANMSTASFDEIEVINFGGANQTATFTGAQLTAETLSLTETAAGTSNLIINVGSGTTATFANITASSFTSGADTVTINGTTGNETITGPNITASLSGGTGADIIVGGTQADSINGGDGADSLSGGSGDDLYLFNTNDVDSGEFITEAGSAGTDAIVIVTSTDFTNMGTASFDEIEEIRFEGSGQTATFTSGQIGSETLSLTEVSSGTSNLIINVGTGENADFTAITANTFDSGSDTLTINGSTGGETILGPNVASTIIGNSGNDNITGGSAGDVINGGGNNDTLDGNDGGDTLTGGSGDDVYVFNTGDVDAGEAIIEASSSGTDTVSITTTTNFTNMSASSFDEIEIIKFSGSNVDATFTSSQLNGETIDLAEVVTGTSDVIINSDTAGENISFANLSASTFTSGTDTLTINGLYGAENITAPTNIAVTLNGLQGNDVLAGGNGVDTFIGGVGADTLTGNNGADIFTWITAGGSDSGLSVSTADTITDFVSGTDQLKLGLAGNSTSGSGNYVESSSPLASLDAAHAAANIALSTLNGTSSEPKLYSFQYDSSNGYLFKDDNSDGTADGMFILTGIDHTEIAHGDIIA